MGKKKETFFERLTRKNAQQEENANPKTRKTRNWKFWVISSVLVASVVAGITIPLAANSLIKNYNDAISDDTEILSFDVEGQKDKSIKFNMSSLKSENSLENAQNPKTVLEQAFKQAIFYLYNEEVKASKEYQRLWNSSRSEDDKERNDIALKDIDSLKQKHENLLLDYKAQFVKSFGYSKWEAAFNDFLIKNYNGAKTIEEAVDLKVYSEIQHDALRRFRLNSQFNIKDIDRVATNDIYKIDDSGKLTNEILFKKGERVFPFFQKDINYFEIKDIKEKMTFMTDSFVVAVNNDPKVYNYEYKNAEKFITHFLRNNNPFLVSQFTFPGVAPDKKEADKETKWTIDKKTFKKMMFYWPAAEQKPFDGAISFEKINSGFKSYDEYVKITESDKTNELNKKIVEFSTVLSHLSSDDEEIKKNWGSSGLTSITELFKKGGDDTLKAFSTLDNLLYDNGQIPEVDLFGTLTTIRNNIIKEFKIANPINDIKSATDRQVAQNLIGQFNEEIKKVFDEASDVKKTGLTTDKFNDLVVKPITELFEKDGKISTVYKLKGDNNTRVILSSKGITLLKMKNIDEFKTQDLNSQELVIKDMIKKDFYLSNKYKNSINGKKYNALSLINNSMASPDIVLGQMLNNADFVNYLKQQNNIYAIDENGNLLENVKYSDKDINEIKEMNDNIAISFKARESLELTKAVDKWMKDRATANYDDLFELKNDKVYFKKNNSNYEKDANSIVYDELLKLRKVK
ncbi:hypothetical protein KQ874_02170 [Mycoplasma sp. ES3157-GEN-MYC]|uniref:Uncharacterized protein n=1 Tax=Mycoplasma miroungigenitalium TaxID=754515 RepID=A0A6M4JBE7_9MOLU|nr:hypothetical protein [Mycoplasma miroungigenitalium]MBU4690493.1 hypothetical protein [Mycoplasma miroungigenitalium]MBU4691760.1 hypothetical protein [Mycoplasma miroungigenitalium]QJR43588.1 hypothetical protein HLA87_02175 [Mycoplasma miroungigenitalium]